VTDFESQSTDFVLEDGSEDFVTDDSALAVVLPDGLFVITGCGHAGIVNTLEHARKVTGVTGISGIMGGFHLKERNRQLDETINYLMRAGVRHVVPSHCTQLPAMCAFIANFSLRSIVSGDVLAF
jgi:7,8-dihydropterin-6-yl-methyl-4-(beta-D-ribofuranosyl)aminobenzene 5'-phosphate synthase